MAIEKSRVEDLELRDKYFLSTQGNPLCLCDYESIFDLFYYILIEEVIITPTFGYFEVHKLQYYQTLPVVTSTLSVAKYFDGLVPLLPFWSFRQHFMYRINDNIVGWGPITLFMRDCIGHTLMGIIILMGGVPLSSQYWKPCY